MESTSRESLGGEKMEATFSKKENTRKAKTKKAEKVTPGGILVIILLTLLASSKHPFLCAALDQSL